MIANRIIVHQAVHDEFVRTLCRAREGVEGLGDPKDPKTIIGPIINQQQFKGIMAHIDTACKEGATEVLGGEAKGLMISASYFHRRHDEDVHCTRRNLWSGRSHH